jgi:AraC-like DNA-binding protein
LSDDACSDRLSGRLQEGGGAMSGERKWQGEAHLALGWAAFHGRSGDSRPHRHHAVQLVIGDREPVRVWTEDGSRVAEHGLAIGSDRLHRLQGGPPVLMVYVETESDSGRALQRWIGNGSRALDAGQARAAHDWWQRRASWPADAERELVQRLGVPQPEASAVHAGEQRVEQVLQALPRLAVLPQRLDQVAAMAALSPSRFAHLFQQRTGIAVRPYLRWLRLQRAAGALARGVPPTDAALAAGFADAAHMSRTFRRHLGVTPGAIAALGGVSADTFKTDAAGR